MRLTSPISAPPQGAMFEPDQQAVRPAIVLGKIDERQFFLSLVHANSLSYGKAEPWT